jgi:cell division septation protein DedD
MEHFEEQGKRVREKSVYLLHLDGPRIVIIGSLIVALVAGAFLIGMHFMGPSDSASDLRLGSEFESDRPFDVARGNMPELPSDSMGTINSDGSIVMDDDKESGNKSEDEDTIDLITGDSITQTTPPDNSVEKKRERETPEKKVSTKREPEKKTRHKKPAVEKKREPAPKKKKRNDSRVVAVSVSDYEMKKAPSPYFAIQIVSYDEKGRARKEVDRLRDMKYDAYIDPSRINGKLYYRVRIGPITSKDRAFATLDRVQGLDRYSESYLVRETN